MISLFTVLRGYCNTGFRLAQSLRKASSKKFSSEYPQLQHAPLLWKLLDTVAAKLLMITGSFQSTSDLSGNSFASCTRLQTCIIPFT